MYREIMLNGVRCYTDAYIVSEFGVLFFISIFGRPNTVKAVGAALIEGYDIKIGKSFYNRPSDSLKTVTHNLNGICHKVVFSPDHFTGSTSRIVIGDDMKRAYAYLDSNTTTPLKHEWSEWLWDKVFQADKLHGFGSIEDKNLKDSYLLSITKSSEEIDEMVLDGIRTGEIH